MNIVLPAHTCNKLNLTSITFDTGQHSTDDGRTHGKGGVKVAYPHLVVGHLDNHLSTCHHVGLVDVDESSCVCSKILSSIQSILQLDVMALGVSELTCNGRQYGRQYLITGKFEGYYNLANESLKPPWRF